MLHAWNNKVKDRRQAEEYDNDANCTARKLNCTKLHPKEQLFQLVSAKQAKTIE